MDYKILWLLQDAHIRKKIEKKTANVLSIRLFRFCYLRSGDCFGETSIATCYNTKSCSVYASAVTLTKCSNKISEYLHIKYNCVPSITF